MSRTVTIIGAGNGGCAGAADLTRQGFEVTLYNRGPARLEPLRRQGGVRLKDPADHGVVPIARLTGDIAEALAGSSRIAVMLPTSTLELYAGLMAPHLREDHQILLLPGHTGGALYLKRALAALRPDFRPAIGETHTLPYICRMTGQGEVTLWKRSEKLFFAALPATATAWLQAGFGEVFPALQPVGSVLESSLININAVMHPAGMLLNAGWIERTAGDFRYYSEGNPPAVGRVVQAVDDERLAIGAALGLKLRPFIDTFYELRYTTEAAWRSRDVSRAITESPPNLEIRAPASLDHRYVHEDVGFGLVPMLAFAAAAGVAAPTIAAIVTLVNVATGIDYSQTGLNADRLGIAGLDGSTLRRYAMNGYR